jgi:Cdc6-like AAA superfamily ATPase
MDTTKKTIPNETKKQIAAELLNYVNNIANGSANKASKMLKNVSNGYISLVLNGKYEALSDDAWRNIQKQVCTGTNWQYVETRGYKFLTQLFDDAKRYANTYGVIGNAGTGKTKTAINIAQNNVFVIKANEYFTSRTFLEELLSLMGKNGYSYSVSAMMSMIIETLLKLESPLIIIDEADKLNDKVMYFFISLYNALEGKCGLVIIATPYLKRKIDDGLLKNKRGYQEIYSRIGRNFLEVPNPSKTDVTKICRANGISDDVIINSIYNTCELDLRKVERQVHAQLKLQQ